MNEKTKKLEQIASVLRLAENLIHEFNRMDGETEIIRVDIKDDIDPIDIQLFGGTQDLALEFRRMPPQRVSNAYLTEYALRDNCVYIHYPEYFYDFQREEDADAELVI